MKLLSQHDSRWKNIRLGFTTNTTIGSHGCTITCIAMLADVNPDYVNERLKTVGGYANGNLVIWSKVPKALPQLQFVKRVNEYDNDEVKKNTPCLVEANGVRIAGFKHWVVFIGNQKMYDPWDGKEKSTNYYAPLTGYALFKVKDLQTELTPSQKLQRIKEIVLSGSPDGDKIYLIKQLLAV